MDTEGRGDASQTPKGHLKITRSRQPVAAYAAERGPSGGRGFPKTAHLERKPKG